MKKILVAILLIVAVAVVLLYFTLSTMLGAGVKAATQTIAPKVLGTEVTMGDVQLSLMQGSIRMTEVTVYNPEGFQTEQAVYLGEVIFDIQPLSLLGEHVIIEKVYIDQPQFTYERTLRSSNIDAILQHVRGDPAPAEPAPEGEAPAKEMRVEIQDLLIESGQVTLAGLGRSVDVPLPRIAFQGIGTDEGGIPPSEALSEVLELILEQVKNVGIEAIKKVDITDPEARQQLLEQPGKLKDKAGEALKGLFGN